MQSARPGITAGVNARLSQLYLGAASQKNYAIDRAAHQTSDRETDFFRRQLVRCHLVEQRLEQVVVGPVHQRDLHRGVPFGDLIFRFDFGVIAPEVCEDAWTAECPMRRRVYSGAELVLTNTFVGASPEEAAAGSDDPQRQAEIILEDSDERTEDPEQTKRNSVQTPD